MVIVGTWNYGSYYFVLLIVSVVFCIFSTVTEENSGDTSLCFVGKRRLRPEKRKIMFANLTFILLYINLIDLLICLCISYLFIKSFGLLQTF